MARQDHALSALLAEQIAYYRARASEYDEWWLRTGGYDKGPADAARFARQVAELNEAFAAFAPSGDVLELACGTGLWTEALARAPVTLTCVDAAPEMLALNRARLQSAGLQEPRYIQADIFAWEPAARFDAVFFAFWISHVPAALFDAFWEKVRRALKPGGRAFFIDEPPSEFHHYRVTDSEGRQRRETNDGRPFTIVKYYFTPDELTQRLSALNWRANVRQTSNLFIYGEASPL